ncbi:MAG: YoaK family protein [Burkholderiaceae bacterium]|jgi:uncharacterized membrane protein YoaK (UPF0700 family)
MKPVFPLVQATNAGFVDTVGFLALHGLFTAHVTGNFVTLGASLVLGTSGVFAKLLALPVFCAFVILARLIRYRLIDSRLPVLRMLLLIKLVLFIVAGILAIRFGPFPNGDSELAILTGMTLVAAMAIQNAAHRVHLASFPPSTLMTGTTTQIMLDLADLIHGVSGEARAAVASRLGRMSASVISFALGCGLAALAYTVSSTWCFAVPALLGLLALAIIPVEPAEVPKPATPA